MFDVYCRKLSCFLDWRVNVLSGIRRARISCFFSATWIDVTPCWLTLVLCVKTHTFRTNSTIEDRNNCKTSCMPQTSTVLLPEFVAIHASPYLTHVHTCTYITSRSQTDLCAFSCVSSGSRCERKTWYSPIWCRETASLQCELWKWTNRDVVDQRLQRSR